MYETMRKANIFKQISAFFPSPFPSPLSYLTWLDMCSERRRKILKALWAKKAAFRKRREGKKKIFKALCAEKAAFRKCSEGRRKIQKALCAEKDAFRKCSERKKKKF